MKINKKIAVVTLGVLLVPTLTGCASWERLKKDANSEFGNGLPREIKVYDVNGKKILDDKGKFDIDYNDNRLQYVDENNKKHNIYTGAGTVIVKEINKKDLKK